MPGAGLGAWLRPLSEHAADAGRGRVSTQTGRQPCAAARRRQAAPRCHPAAGAPGRARAPGRRGRRQLARLAQHGHEEAARVRGVRQHAQAALQRRRGVGRGREHAAHHLGRAGLRAKIGALRGGARRTRARGRAGRRRTASAAAQDVKKPSLACTPQVRRPGARRSAGRRPDTSTSSSAPPASRSTCARARPALGAWPARRLGRGARGAPAVRAGAAPRRPPPRPPPG